MFEGCSGPVLCLSNLLSDHAGVEDGDPLPCVIDFEHALAGPGEYDYWRTALPVFESRERPDRHAAFRNGYESVRSLPAGFDRRADLYRVLNTVSYLKALYLQRQVTGEEAERRAEWTAGYVRDALGDLRAKYE